MHDVVEIFGRKINRRQALIDISRDECEESLAEFIRQAWHIVEPGADYIHNWHVDLICESLTAITEGVEFDDGTLYNRLLINVPPGMMKSLLTNVFWPSWEWGPRNMPHMRYLCASHSMDLAIRDSTKMRRLIESEWYQERWGDRVQITKDQNQKTKFELTSTGFRQAVAAGSITGARGDRVIIDDPHSVEGANSDQQRASTLEWFLEAVPTRLNKPLESAIVVIMQRLHEEDVSGVILSKGLGYDHIMLPMRYEPGRAHETMLGLDDPRSEEGELLFPSRFPEVVVDRDELAMGPYAVAGQFQQSPEPRGGGVIKRDWWTKWDQPSYPPFDYVIAAIDTAYTTKAENDPSAMTVWGVWKGGDQTAVVTRALDKDGQMAILNRQYKEEHPKCMLMYAWAERLELHELIDKVQETMDAYGVDKLLIENKASGYSVAQEIRRVYGYDEFAVHLIDPKGLDKLARLYSIQHLFAEGLIYAPTGRPWAEMVINQAAQFPRGKHDDLVDTTSMALKHLREIGLLVRGAEWTANLDESRMHEGAGPQPLYPV